MTPEISLVVPVFNEEKTIPIFYDVIRSFPGLAGISVEIVFINDGSRDRTEDLLKLPRLQIGGFCYR